MKIYGKPPGSKEYHRYCPADVTGCQLAVIQGKPDRRYISTSYAERQNLTMRMQMRRYRRLTNGFSKKVENLRYAVALHFMHYNFCRIHKSLRVTPAMEAGMSDRLWEIDDLIGLLDE